ncbi:MAG TPA: molybdate ABC transporter permease subunit [Afifellaceae bacterium]|nr:molybdate ABC transporter permease subunit [Afifellaceae bacterium]
MLSPEAADALLLSIKVASVALLFALPLALFIAYALARWTFPGRNLLQIAVYLPLVLPPVVTGYLLLLAFGPNGSAGRLLENLFGLELAFRWTGAALAAGVMAFPLLLRPIMLSFQNIDQRLERAAETLGASRMTIFVTVTLPLALPGILAGVALGFAKALGEFGATITFAANIPGETRTLALAVHTALQRSDGDQLALGLALLSVAVGVVAIGLAELPLGRPIRKLAAMASAKTHRKRRA